MEEVVQCNAATRRKALPQSPLVLTLLGQGKTALKHNSANPPGLTQPWDREQNPSARVQPPSFAYGWGQPASPRAAQPGCGRLRVKALGVKALGVKALGVKVLSVKASGVKAPGVKALGVKVLGVKAPAIIMCSV